MEIKPFKIQVTPEKSRIVQETLFAKIGWYDPENSKPKGYRFLMVGYDNNDGRYFVDHAKQDLKC
jgi:hypothetical protein